MDSGTGINRGLRREGAELPGKRPMQSGFVSGNRLHRAEAGIYLLQGTHFPDARQISFHIHDIHRRPGLKPYFRLLIITSQIIPDQMAS